MSDADCTPGREPRSVAASLTGFVCSFILAVARSELPSFSKQLCLLFQLHVAALSDTSQPKTSGDFGRDPKPALAAPSPAMQSKLLLTTECAVSNKCRLSGGV